MKFGLLVKSVYGSNGSFLQKCPQQGVPFLYESLSEPESPGLKAPFAAEIINCTFSDGKKYQKESAPGSYKKQVVAGNFITRAGPALQQ